MLAQNNMSGSSASLNNSGGSGIGNNHSKNSSGMEDPCEDGHSQMADKLNEHSQSQSNSSVQIRPVQIRSHEDGSSGYGSPDSVMSDSAK